MARGKKVDGKALCEMIKESKPQSEIMEKFGFKNSTQLKVAYANALMETGEAPKIIGKGRTKKIKPVDNKVTVNTRGSLIIPKALVDYLEIKEGQIFEVKLTKSGLQLKNVEKEGD